MSQELKTPGEQVLTELQAALQAGDAKASGRLLGEVGGLYRFPASKREAAALLELAGRAAGHKDPVIAGAALRALGDTRAPKAVEWIKPLLRAKAGEEQRTIAAVQAAGRLRSGTLVAPLADLAKTAGNLVLAGQAYLALGEYADAPTDLRKRVADKTLALCGLAERNRKRWRHLRAPGLRALQRLMGRRLNRVEQFEDWWKFAKARKDPWAK
ncbi:MAG: hypothetical protein ACYTGN_09540 [Planctomycetota bacterium]